MIVFSFGMMKETAFSSPPDRLKWQSDTKFSFFYSKSVNTTHALYGIEPVILSLHALFERRGYVHHQQALSVFQLNWIIHRRQICHHNINPIVWFFTIQVDTLISKEEIQHFKIALVTWGNPQIKKTQSFLTNIHPMPHNCLLMSKSMSPCNPFFLASLMIKSRANSFFTSSSKAPPTIKWMDW